MKWAVLVVAGLLALAGCGETYYNDPDQVRPSTTTTTVEHEQPPRRWPPRPRTSMSLPPQRDMSEFVPDRPPAPPVDEPGPAVTCHEGPCRPFDYSEFVQDQLEDWRGDGYEDRQGP